MKKQLRALPADTSSEESMTSKYTLYPNNSKLARRAVGERDVALGFPKFNAHIPGLAQDG